MAITSLPAPPSRSDPENFAERADAFMAALPQFAEQANTLQTEVNQTAVSVDNGAIAAAASSMYAEDRAESAQASAEAATEARQVATQKATDAGASAGLAEQWATKLGAPVDGDRFSAQHYAQVAAIGAGMPVVFAGSIPTSNIGPVYISGQGPAEWDASRGAYQLTDRVALSAATDANTLIADNTYFTWVDQTAMGANFPNIVGSGYMRVYVIGSNVIAQELTVIIPGRKPYSFCRTGNFGTGVWQAWRVSSTFSTVATMPNFDAGDVYVDGSGVYRWNGSAYVLADLSLIEAGSNSLGTYYKYASGDMICLINQVVNITGVTWTTGAPSYAIITGVSFPAAFVAAPLLTSMALRDGLVANRSAYLSATSSVTAVAIGTVYLSAPNTSPATGGTVTVTGIATGRWKA